jgi:hypothetical protein
LTGARSAPEIFLIFEAAKYKSFYKFSFRMSNLLSENALIKVQFTNARGFHCFNFEFTSAREYYTGWILNLPAHANVTGWILNLPAHANVIV